MGTSQKSRETSLKGFSLAKSGIIWTLKYIMIVWNSNPPNSKTSQIPTSKNKWINKLEVWRRGYLPCFKIPPHKYLLITGGESNFTMDKPGKHHLSQANKGNITNNGIIKIVLPSNMQWEQCHIFDLPAQNAQPESNQEETSGKSKWRDILQSNCHVILKNFRSWKERVRNCYKLKETKDKWH